MLLATTQGKCIKKFYGPFLWMGFKSLKATEPLQKGSSLLLSLNPQEFLVLIGLTLSG